MSLRRAVESRLASWGPEKISLGGLVVLTVGSVLAVGGNPVGVTVAAGVVATLTVLASRAAGSRRQRSVAKVTLLLLALAAFSVLQAAPLPLRVVQYFSEAGADIWARALVAVDKPQSWGALSLEPSSSLVEACKFATYACVFQLGVGLARTGQSRAGFRVVLLAATLLSLATVGHQLVGAKTVFGLYKPANDFAVHGIAPLLNPNHLAGYTNLGAHVGLGLLLDGRTRFPKWLVAAGTLICVGVSLRAASRGGAVGLLLGIVVFGAVTAFQAIRRPSADQAPWWVGAALGGATAALGAGLAMLGYNDTLKAELTDPSTGKLALASWVPPMLHDHWKVGVGRGAFESAFEAYRPAIGKNIVFTHPENFVVQWAAEWGVVGVAALIVLGWWLRPTRLSLMRSPAHAGAGAAALALLAHNLVDFSLELPGPAIALSLLLGLITSPEQGGMLRSRWLAPVVAATTLIFSVAAGIKGEPSLYTARELVRARVNSDASEGAAALVERMSLRFPADYYFPLMGGVLAEKTGQNPMPWIQRALERGPTVGRTHLLLAQVLGSRGLYKQGALELRLAVELENGLSKQAAKIGSSWPLAVDELAAIVPDGGYGPLMFEVLIGEQMRRGRSDDAARLDAIAVERFPETVAPRVRLVDRLVARIETGGCDGSCEAEIEGHATQLLAQHPEDSAGDVVRARLALSKKDEPKAREILRPACQKKEGELACLRLLASVEEDVRLELVFSRYLATVCVDRAACAGANDWVASSYASRKQWARAFNAAEKAARDQPTAERWRTAAALATKADLKADADHAEREAAKLAK